MTRTGRGRILSVLLAVGALSLAVSASQQLPAGRGLGQDGPKVVEVEKLKDNLFVLKGGGGNTAASSPRTASSSSTRKSQAGVSR